MRPVTAGVNEVSGLATSSPGLGPDLVSELAKTYSGSYEACRIPEKVTGRSFQRVARRSKQREEPR